MLSSLGDCNSQKHEAILFFSFSLPSYPPSINRLPFDQEAYLLKSSTPYQSTTLLIQTYRSASLAVGSWKTRRTGLSGSSVWPVPGWFDGERGRITER